MNFLCEYALDNQYELKFALEAKPNEPRGDIYNPTTGHMLAFINTLEHPQMVGVNPEVAHEHMAGLNFMHAVAQAWEAGKLFHIDLNDQYPGRYDQDLRFGSCDVKAAFYLVKFLEDVGYSGSRHFDAHAYRTEDYEGVKDFALGCMRTYLILKDKAAQFNADAEIQALLAEISNYDGSAMVDVSKYSPEVAASLKAQTFDRTAIASRGLKYERLDQLMIDERGNVAAVASSPHTLQTPRPLWSEENPEQWWEAVRASIRAVLNRAQIRSADVAAVGLTGQMHGLVLLDGAGLVLRPAILWNDQRTQTQCDEVYRRVGKERFIQITGNQALPGFTAPKILWVAENEPRVYAKVRHILLPKDYIRFRLTGKYAMDKADGSGTVLFNLHERNWSAEVLASLEINPEWLPPTYEGTQFTGKVSADAAAQTGLLAGTPVIAGGGDQSTQAVGVGAVEPGVVALTLGTSGVVFATTPSMLIEPEGRLHAFCHAVPGMWHLMGVMLSATGSFQWYRDTLAQGIEFDDLEKEAQAVPAGSDGLLFLPYLSGERTPHPDPLARGAFIGLTLRHTRGHLTRSVLEGVAFGLKDSFTLLEEAGIGEVQQVRASGGGIKSALWRQILANVLEVELVTVNAVEGAAYGAALLAGVGSGMWPNVSVACKQLIKVTGSTAPDQRQIEQYRKCYLVYRELYPQLKSSFQRMV
jgi:xylulokinase